MLYLFIMQTICFIITKYYLYKYNYPNWNVAFANCTSIVGETIYNQKIIRFSNLYLKNCNILFDLFKLRTLILHEIAHVISGYNNGHNSHWKNCCINIGGNGQRLTSIRIYKSDYPWRLECSNKACSQEEIYCFRRYMVHCPTCGSYLKVFDNQSSIYTRKIHQMKTRYF